MGGEGEVENKYYEEMELESIWKRRHNINIDPFEIQALCKKTG